MLNLGTVIKSLRNERRFTQEQLSEMLGVSTAAVSKWECGSAYPDITLLPKLAECFNVSLDYLFGYNIAEKHTIPEVIAEAAALSRGGKRDDSIALLSRTLVRYPNNHRLIFELSRHKFVGARHKSGTERAAMINEAAEGFVYIAENSDDPDRRAWAVHFLTTISIERRDFDKAREYNRQLLGGDGLYPRVSRAVIDMIQNNNKDAYARLMETIYGTLYEFSLLIAWIAPYHYEHGDFDEIIKEYTRAVHILEEFADTGLFYNDLSCCHETLAMVYAEQKEYERCLFHLEEACRFSLMHDSMDSHPMYNIRSIVGEMLETEETSESSKTLLHTLSCSERAVYDPIRENERFQSILKKLSVQSIPIT